MVWNTLHISSFLLLESLGWKPISGINLREKIYWSHWKQRQRLLLGSLHVNKFCSPAGKRNNRFGSSRCKWSHSSPGIAFYMVEMSDMWERDAHTSNHHYYMSVIWFLNSLMSDGEESCWPGQMLMKWHQCPHHTPLGISLGVSLSSELNAGKHRFQALSLYLCLCLYVCLPLREEGISPTFIGLPPLPKYEQKCLI